MIPILVEENYSGNNRFHRLLEGMGTVAAKRHEELCVFKEAQALPEGTRVVILVCQSLKWSAEHVAILNRRGIHPLLFGFSYPDTMHDYSSLSPNYTRGAYRLTKHLLSHRLQKVAVLGYNEDSLPDRLKLTGVRYAASEAGQAVEVIGNRGDVIACIEDFSARCESVGNIICCNDSVAVMLYCKYPHLVRGRSVGSCSGLKISEFFAERYPVCRIDHFAAGARLASLYLFLAKEQPICSTAMTFDMELSFEEEPLSEVRAEWQSHAAVDFYGDRNFGRMERLDRMLTDCDGTDLGILADVTAGRTYAEIAERRYLALNTVKYRIKKMLDAAGVDSRKALLDLIGEFGLRF